MSVAIQDITGEEVIDTLPKVMKRLRPCMASKSLTLPETNSSPLKMVVSNRNLLFQGAPIFRGELLVSGGVVFQYAKNIGLGVLVVGWDH